MGLAKALALLVLLTGLLPLARWVDRKQAALMQDRVGPNRARLLGFRAVGLFHPLASLLRGVSKQRDAGLHLAPVMAALASLLAFAVVPWGGTYELFGSRFSLSVADPEGGVLIALLLGTIAAFSPVISGWASGSPWGALGALRSASGVLSYQLALVASLLAVFMVFGTLRLGEMSLAQQGSFRLLGFAVHMGWLSAGTWLDCLTLPSWGIAVQPLSFVLLGTALLMGVGRSPFDAARADSELRGGYLASCGGPDLGVYLLAQWLQVTLVAAVMTHLFLGGWSLPWLSDASLLAALVAHVGSDLANLLAMVLHVSVFTAKVLGLIAAQSLVRWVLPRMRHDQTLRLGSKVLLPLSLANVFLTAVGLLAVEGLTA